MAEEQKWQEPGAHKLCANNCGFFGSPTTLDLCSKCYKDYCIKEQQISKAKIAVEKTFESSSSIITVSSQPLILPEKSLDSPAPVNRPNRCAICRRRVGLTGFACRCGPTFCGTHRYPEQHECTFDFKGLGREEISKANPVIKAEKLDKI